MRISFALAKERVVHDVNRKQEDMDRLSTIISSGKKLLDPSDDPHAWAKSMDLKQGLREIETFKSNIQFASSWGKVTDVSLEHLSSLITEAKKIALSAMNGAAPEERAGYVQSLDQILNDALDIANSKHENRYLFAALADLQPPDKPFGPPDGTGHYPFTSESGYDGQLKIRTGKGDSNNPTVNLNGNDVFSFTPEGGTPVYVLDELLALGNAVKNDDSATIQASLGKLDGALQNVQTQRSVLAVRLTNLETQNQALGALKLNAETQLSDLEEADMTAMITKLQQTRTAFEASLRVTSMVEDLNLMKFL